jgi:hypothetical protein
MSSDEMRAVIREVLQEVTNGNGHSKGNGNARQATEDDAPSVVPQVPAPPVAAVLRPSTWDRPPAPGEVIGNAAPAPTPAPAGEGNPRREGLRAAFQDAEFRPTAPSTPPPPTPSAAPASPAVADSGDTRLETVTIDTDDDLAQFVRQLMSRLENPRERLAIRTGRLRFRLRRAAGAPAAAANTATAPVTRVQKGAVTERMIQTAAAEGARLVLAPGAVLTPLAREQARARGVEIERERRC